jgi:hypothetical protein
MLTQTEIERERHDARLKGRCDQASLLADARERAYKKGLYVGEIMGYIRGCQEYLNLSLNSLDELEKLSLRELIQLKEKLWRWVFPSPVEADEPILMLAVNQPAATSRIAPSILSSVSRTSASVIAAQKP